MDDYDDEDYELLGAMDGELDADGEDLANFGLSVDDLDELSDEERMRMRRGIILGREISRDL